MSRPSAPAMQRFMSHVVIGYGGQSLVGSECWLWDGCELAGYGRFGVAAGLSPVMAHRFAWEAHKGPIPAGLHVDHLCRTTRCVNPAHLEPVTPIENLRRSRAKSAVLMNTGFCWRGHDTAISGLYDSPSGGRRCKACVSLLREQTRNRMEPSK